jgi:alpha-L-rhamnosidase
VRSEWELGDGGGLRLRVTVPPGARATVHLPRDGRVVELGYGDHELTA